ncbi:MAG: nitrate reductase associated protein [Candidatus Binatia bacterium]
MRDEKQREADQAAEERLQLMPRGVRDKLDRIRLKLHLAEWQALSMPERERLRDLPCQSADELAQYAAEIERLVRRISGKAPDRLKRRDPEVGGGQDTRLPPGH